MQPKERRRAVLAVRVSTTGQGIDGDSPEAQIEQGTRHAAMRGIEVANVLTYLESASGITQPMQHVIDYAIDPKNKIDVVLIKSIDRFTRAGAPAYVALKDQLEACNIDLQDIYGVINNTKINTLEHLGMQYTWSTHAPSRKSELLEAERAKDEVRDILTRMIGSEIRYTQLGYWSRSARYGYDTTKIETPNGKRTILVESPDEGHIIKKMFELRAQGTLTDDQIAKEMNYLGFKTPVCVLRDRNNRTKIIGKRGGKLMTGKLLRVYIGKTIYAGINTEKWAGPKPVKCKFEGLVSIELFNKANRGKLFISLDEHDPEHATVRQAEKQEKFAKKNVYNAEFPYKKVVSCPTCKHSLLGSASRGKLGKYYPAYHCTSHGHYFRVPKPDFDTVIESFVNSVTVSPERIDELMKAVLTVWERRKEQIEQKEVNIGQRRLELENEIKVIVDKMKLISSRTAIKYMEEDLVRIEKQIADLDTQKGLATGNETLDIPKILTYVKYFMEHLKDLLIDHCNPVMRAKYFGVIFDEVPTYQEIKDGTQNIEKIPGVNEIFRLINPEIVSLVRERGLEPPRPKALAPKASVSTNSTTRAYSRYKVHALLVHSTCIL